MTRRGVLHATIAAAIGLPLSPLASRVVLAVPRPQLKLTPLADGLALVEGAGAHVVVAGAGGELLLVDGGLSEHSRELLKLLSRQYPKGRVRVLINTHWHWDRTGSNEPLAAQGASIVAHENTRLWLGQEINCAWEPRVYPPLPAEARPNQTFFYGSKSMDFGGQAVEYGLMPQAHTDGDIYVYFPKQNVLVAGDVATGGGYPVVDYSTNGWLGGMHTGLKTLIARCDEQTRIVAGTGALLGKADLKVQQDMCYVVLSRIGESYYKGETWEQFLASKPTREFDAKYGNPDLFLRTAYRGAWEHVNEIRRIAR